MSADGSHALRALDQAIRGDPAGLSFIEQTATVYVLDAASTPGSLQVYGWWNFLNEALNDIERHEAEGRAVSPAHVRLLSTVTRRVARRRPSVDRGLVAACIENAASASAASSGLLADGTAARALLAGNDGLRDRTLGRVAAIAFDVCPARSPSSLADPIAAGQFAGVIAANAVCAGPASVGHLVSGWMLKSAGSLPRPSVSAVMYHVAMESTSKGRPGGIRGAVRTLAPPVLRTLGQIYIETLEESGEERVAALSLRAIECWCRLNEIGTVRLGQIFAPTGVNILGALADGLYSNISDVLDADSDLIETLLNQDDSNERVNIGMSIAARALAGASMPQTNQVQVAQDLTGANETARMNLLSELALAVGFQKHRFVQRQQAGDVAVCRCLARTAARVLVAARGSLRTSPDDLLDLLFKAASHPSIYVSGIAIEALADCTAENPNLATRLLPVLQGKAIIQTSLLDDVGSLEDYINFRQRVLAIGFQGCYSGCEGFYLRSCASAIDEFCGASLSPQLPFQLEAALVCMISVSNKATKTSDKQALVSQLEKMVSALVSNDFKTTSHPVVMASLCRFICKYAKCLTWCPTSVYEAACELTLQVFQRDLADYDTRLPWKVITQTSPLSLASDALKSLLCRNPDIFQSPDALSALERAWNLPYQTQKISIEDRETLCSGLAVVIQSLPSGSQETSVTALAKPVLSCVAVLTKNIDEMTTGVDSILIRIGNEIRLLAKLVDVFRKSNREPVVVLVQRTWPAVVHISKAHFATSETLANSVGQYLLASLSLYRSEEDISLLRDIASLVKELMALVADAKSSASLIPLLKFAGQLVKAKQLTNGAEDVTKEVVIATFESLRSGMDELVLATCTYDFLNALAKNSPALLLGLSNGDLVRSSIVDARRSLGAKETDVIRCSSNFLNSLAKSVVSSQRSQAVDAVKQNFASDVTMFTIELTCAGLAPRGGLADLTNLLLTILNVLRWSEIEHAVLAAMGSGKFQLGEEVTRVTVASLRDSTESACVSSNLSEMIDCLWAMHQQSETDGTIAGEELVQDFLQKYSNT